jgi:hypothetical protein
MKGALSSKPSYQFDENGNLVANEGETDEGRSAREAIVLFVEGHSGNHPADVAASNGEEISPEAAEVAGHRSGTVLTEAEEQARSEKAQANDSNDPAYSKPSFEKDNASQYYKDENEEASDPAEEDADAENEETPQQRRERERKERAARLGRK